MLVPNDDSPSPAITLSAPHGASLTRPTVTCGWKARARAQAQAYIAA